jgi:hypothetical protein
MTASHREPQTHVGVCHSTARAHGHSTVPASRRCIRSTSASLTWAINGLPRLEAPPDHLDPALQGEDPKGR